MSYIEALTAAAVFCVLLAPLFAVLSQAARDAAVARSGYAAHLYAQGLMLAVRGAVQAGGDPRPPAEAFALTWAEPLPYGYWLSDGTGYRAPDAPEVEVEVEIEAYDNGDPGGVLITAVVWDATGRPAGRAVGLVNAP